MAEIRIFVSYAHENQRWLREDDPHNLIPYLRAALKGFNVTIWADPDIPPFEKWKDVILEQIDRADIALLLVSTFFLASDFIMDDELPRIQARQRAGELIVAPILVERCGWVGTELIQAAQMLPGPPKTLLQCTQNEVEWDEARASIADAIRQTVLRIRAKRAAALTSEKTAVGPEVEPLPEVATAAQTNVGPDTDAGLRAESASQFPSAPPAPTSRSTGEPSDEVRAAVRKGLDEVHLQIDLDGRGFAWTSRDAVDVWQRLYAAHRDDALMALCDLATEHRLTDWGESKVLALLSWAAREPSCQAHLPPVLDAVSPYLAMAAGTNGDKLQRLALDIVMEAPVPREEKWERLHGQLPRMDANGVQGLVRCLTSVVPQAQRAQLGEGLVLALRRFCSHGPAVAAITRALASLDHREAMPVVRGLLDEGVASAGIAYEFAQLLTQWKDSEVGPVLRRSIEAWRDAEFYGNVRAMVRMLYEVEGPPSLGFIVTTMSEAPAETQLSVLTEVLAKLPADDAVPAARNLAEMTQVPEVRERAEQIAGRG